MADAELRQRKPQAADKPEEKDDAPAKVRSRVKNEDSISPWLDVLRVLTFLFLASYAISYMVSGGESGFWGVKHRPKYLKVDWWKSQLTGPLYLTPEELATYDGSDPSKPVYLAINGTIYDVSKGRHIYGPGGSYQYFAGCDASRAYVTGCFAEDRTPDMRGVELMYIPVDNPETDNANWSPRQLADLKASERRYAEEKVYNGLKHWVDFFAKSKKYIKVGYVKQEKGWLEKLPKRELCAAAQKGRPKRKVPH